MDFSFVYRIILNWATPFVKWWGNLRFPFTKKKVTGVHYFKWRDSIEVGTVLLTKTEGELSNYINPVSSDIKHGGMYIGRIGGIPMVIEALGRGVVFTDLVTFLTTKDRVIGLKPDFHLSNEDKVMLQEEAKKRKGIPYDYLFSKGDKAFYCFELVADIYKSVKPEMVLNREEIVKGYFIYDEGTFLNDPRFKVVFDNKE